MSLLSKLFGGGAAAQKPDPVEHNGYLIFPEPVKDTNGYRIGARVEKGDKVHQLIRADTYNSIDTAVEASVAKARQVIDQTGDRLFD